MAGRRHRMKRSKWMANDMIELHMIDTHCAYAYAHEETILLKAYQVNALPAENAREPNEESLDR